MVGFIVMAALRSGNAAFMVRAIIVMLSSVVQRFERNIAAGTAATAALAAAGRRQTKDQTCWLCTHCYGYGTTMLQLATQTDIL